MKEIKPFAIAFVAQLSLSATITCILGAILVEFESVMIRPDTTSPAKNALLTVIQITGVTGFIKVHAITEFLFNWHGMFVLDHEQNEKRVALRSRVTNFRRLVSFGFFLYAGGFFCILGFGMHSFDLTFEAEMQRLPDPATELVAPEPVPPLSLRGCQLLEPQLFGNFNNEAAIYVGDAKEFNQLVMGSSNDTAELGSVKVATPVQLYEISSGIGTAIELVVRFYQDTNAVYTDPASREFYEQQVISSDFISPSNPDLCWDSIREALL